MAFHQVFAKTSLISDCYTPHFQIWLRSIGNGILYICIKYLLEMLRFVH